MNAISNDYFITNLLPSTPVEDFKHRSIMIKVMTKIAAYFLDQPAVWTLNCCCLPRNI